jgi:hypothetical protein
MPMTVIPSCVHLVQSTMCLLDDLPTGQRGGTGAVLGHLATMAISWGPGSVRASCLKEAHGGAEYLLDLTVRDGAACDRDEDPFSYHALVLAVEVEWSPNRVERRYDFCKLADVRARRRLFVGACSARDWTGVDEEVSAMQKFLDNHQMVLPEDEFGVVLCGYSAEEPMRGWVLRPSRPREEVHLGGRDSDLGANRGA